MTTPTSLLIAKGLLFASMLLIISNKLYNLKQVQ